MMASSMSGTMMMIMMEFQVRSIKINRNLYLSIVNVLHFFKDSEDEDSNGDGIIDCQPKDSDGDGIPDHLDDDDDNDGIPDHLDPDHTAFLMYKPKNLEAMSGALNFFPVGKF